MNRAEIKKRCLAFLKARPDLKLREAPEDLVDRLFKIFHLLSIPTPVDTNAQSEILYAKFLFSLWNLIIDDSIDREERELHMIALHESAAVLNACQMNVDSASALVLRELLQTLSLLESKKNTGLIRLLYFDINSALLGFEFDAATQRNLCLGYEEYISTGALTIDSRFFVTIDCIASNVPYSPHSLRHLREAYLWFSRAFKVSSDIATYNRELLEKSNNAVFVKAYELNLLSDQWWASTDTDSLTIDSSNMEMILLELKGEMDRYLQKAYTNLDASGIGASDSIKRVFLLLCSDYPGQK